jgi:D-glycero-alpha-D-manno-heptose-7-phosphate kinase
MIISRAPLRISLFGGGSDLPSYSNIAKGAVLNFSINKYVYIALHQNFLENIQLKYSQSENVKEASEIKHPIFRETLLMLGLNDSVEIGSFADVPASGTGLGSSSAFTVALIRAIHEYQGIVSTKAEIATMACEIEINRCKDPIGRQDQWASALGGINKIEFIKDKVEFQPIKLNALQAESLSKRLYLFHVGGTRDSHKILKQQGVSIRENSSTFKTLTRMVELVEVAKTSIEESEYDYLGELLDETWKLKKSINKEISGNQIDEIYEIAKRNGAIGGKLLGAGGAGFMLFIPKSDSEERLLKALQNFRHVPFKIENNGVEIVFSKGDD